MSNAQIPFSHIFLKASINHCYPTESKILSEYKGLTIEDIQTCYLLATRFLESTDFMPLMEESG
jgi:hypothetical protein